MYKNLLTSGKNSWTVQLLSYKISGVVRKKINWNPLVSGEWFKKIAKGRQKAKYDSGSRGGGENHYHWNGRISYSNGHQKQFFWSIFRRPNHRGNAEKARLGWPSQSSRFHRIIVSCDNNNIVAVRFWCLSIIFVYTYLFFFIRALVLHARPTDRSLLTSSPLESISSCEAATRRWRKRWRKYDGRPCALRRTTGRPRG